ncbi:MAG: M28 family peptidase [Chloroflexi bacterium]|nr:M28 family peptidase [Chloroflexota bacterium]
MMTVEHLAAQAKAYLQKLCVDIPERTVGSAGNHAAVDFFAERMAAFGFGVTTPGFDCMDWRQQGATLRSSEGAAFAVFPSPYARGCSVSAPLVAVSSVAELEAATLGDALLLLHGEIAAEPLMPKNFPFYNPDEHQRIIRLLESKPPRAIITASARNSAMGGALYPLPLLEDGDFDIPSVYTTAEEGQRLAAFAGQTLALASQAERIAATGCNVVARKGAADTQRVVFFAHIDAKQGTPGAIDNASGCVILLLLAELLKDYSGAPGVEIVALNGEDYYCAPGEQLWLAQNSGKFETITLGVNIDGVGYVNGGVAYSLYQCPADMAETLRGVFADYPLLSEGEAWYQGDHMLFLMQQRPALAFTSENLLELMTEIVHTTKDVPAVIDTHKLAQTALALRVGFERLAVSG